MSKRTLLFTLAILIIVVPFLGFPIAWKKFLLLLIGFMTLYVAYSAKSKPLESKNLIETFVENKDELPVLEARTPEAVTIEVPTEQEVQVRKRRTRKKPMEMNDIAIEDAPQPSPYHENPNFDE